MKRELYSRDFPEFCQNFVSHCRVCQNPLCSLISRPMLVTGKMVGSTRRKIENNQPLLLPSPPVHWEPIFVCFAKSFGWPFRVVGGGQRREDWECVAEGWLGLGAAPCLLLRAAWGSIADIDLGPEQLHPLSKESWLRWLRAAHRRHLTGRDLPRWCVSALANMLLLIRRRCNKFKMIKLIRYYHISKNMFYGLFGKS